MAFLAAPFIALVPAVALSLTRGGASVGRPPRTAALTTAQGAGAVAGALVLPAARGPDRPGPTLAWSLALLPVALIGYGARPVAVAGASRRCSRVGLVYMGVLSGLQTAAQLHAPAAYRGRVLSFFLVALGVAYPIGALAQGPVADHIGVGWTTVGAALALAVICVLVAWRSPGFRPGAGRPRAAARPTATMRPVPGRRTAEC